MHVDDVLVAREHQGLARHVRHRRVGIDRGRVGLGVADLHLCLTRDRRRVNGLDQRQAEIEARQDGAVVFAEAENDADLVRLDAEGEGRVADEAEDDDDNGDDGDRADAAATAAATREHAAKAILTTTKKLFQIGRGLTPATAAGVSRPLAPWAAIAAPPAAAPAHFVHRRHSLPFVRRPGRMTLGVIEITGFRDWPPYRRMVRLPQIA